MIKEDLDFQINFYEGLIKDKPDYIQALVILGDAYSRKKLYYKTLKIDQRLVELKPQSPDFHYNLACSYSCLGEIELAFESLKRALKLGYTDLNFMDTDEDLKNIRKDKRYQEIKTKLLNNKLAI